MGRFSESVGRVIDGHVHLGALDRLDRLESVRAELGFERINLVCVAFRDVVNLNHNAYVAKAACPGAYSIFPGLDHTDWWSEGEVAAPSLAEQVDRLRAVGADGIKMLESIPQVHRELFEPLDGPYYADYFARVAELDLPLIWHVGNPPEFWDRAAIPRWARELGWLYDGSFPTNGPLRAQAEAVLDRHPSLKVIFPHFYFHSTELARAAGLFERFPNVCFDLALGIELCFNLSADPDASREFITRFADRIVFGTDIMTSQSVDQACVRAHIIGRFLETDEVFRVPDDADGWLGPGEGGEIVGLSLPADVLEKIYAGNFLRVAGEETAPLDIPAAIEECNRVAAILARRDNTDPADAEPGLAAARLGEIQGS
ncbi:MAG: amidohydrolase family protein [Planctomycetota bacterium]|jgi:predicted TIM-barrel fold metal-dependent hydrolase